MTTPAPVGALVLRAPSGTSRTLLRWSLRLKIAVMDVTPYLANLRRMQADSDREEMARAAEARARLPELVGVLVAFGAGRVVLFGSLLYGALHERSDVDIAVQGLPAACYWDALVRAEEVMGRHVDLVPLEDARPTLQARIAATGEVLHG